MNRNAGPALPEYAAEIIRAEVRGADLVLLLDDVTLHLVA